MDKLIIVTCNGYLGTYGAEYYIVGVYSSKQKAKEAIDSLEPNMQGRCTVHELQLDKTYPLFTDTEGFSSENGHYIGGYYE